MIAPNRIKFQKIFSNELNIPDLIMECAFESDNSEVSTYLNRESVSVESHDGRHNNTMRYKYSERFSPRFTFLKKGFGDFEITEARAVLKWLTSSDTPSLLDVYYDDSNVIEWSAIGNWTSIESYKLANNRTVGVVATFEAITPYAMSDLRSTGPKTITSTDNKIIINIDTDDNKPIYPRITIQEKGSVIDIPSDTVYDIYSDMVPNTVYYNGTTYYWKSDEAALCTGDTEPNYGWPKVIRDTVYAIADEIKEETVYYYTSDQKYRWIDPYTFKASTTNPNLSTTSVRFTNTHTDFLNNSKIYGPTIVKNNIVGEKIVVDGANKILSSSGARRIFGDDFVNWKWLELYDGKNEIAIDGNCEVTLEYREVRKVGEY